MEIHDSGTLAQLNFELSINLRLFDLVKAIFRGKFEETHLNELKDDWKRKILGKTAKWLRLELGREIFGLNLVERLKFCKTISSSESCQMIKILKNPQQH